MLQRTLGCLQTDWTHLMHRADKFHLDADLFHLTQVFFLPMSLVGQWALKYGRVGIQTHQAYGTHRADVKSLDADAIRPTQIFFLLMEAFEGPAAPAT